MEQRKVNSVQYAERYQWAPNCGAWTLFSDGSLVVKEEQMGAGSSERLHFHARARQVFYILEGAAVFECGEASYPLASGECIHVLPGEPHRILNCVGRPLRFLVISSPATADDRIDLSP
jgi:mannose-6-phosphate isomerase-like protein (cupin superfamily)